MYGYTAHLMAKLISLAVVVAMTIGLGLVAAIGGVQGAEFGRMAANLLVH